MHNYDEQVFSALMRPYISLLSGDIGWSEWDMIDHKKKVK